MKKPRVLILCTGNSCRSHMAEGILRHAAGGLLEVHSAGSKPAGYVHPLAIEVMAEIGIDISGHRSKHLEEFLAQEIDTVITVCGRADQVCPTFPGQVRRYHWGFDDPAHASGTQEEVLAVFRRVRDEIRLVFEAYASGYRDHSCGQDQLEAIFAMQAALNRRIGVKLGNLDDAEKAHWVLNYARALQQETAELVDSVPWKWWAKYQKFDEQNAKVEVVDLFHFLVSLAQTLGMNAGDFYAAYLKKNQVNHARQDSGYTTKDESDSRHI